MSLNPTGLSLAVDSLQSGLMFAQLHSASAGEFGTANIVGGGRQHLYWNPPVTGSFTLASPLRFAGMNSYEPVHSVTLWDQETDGTLLGEITFSGGDTTANGNGEFIVTAIDFTLTATDV